MTEHEVQVFIGGHAVDLMGFYRASRHYFWSSKSLDESKAEAEALPDAMWAAQLAGISASTLTIAVALTISIKYYY